MTSGLLPATDIVKPAYLVRFVPTCDIVPADTSIRKAARRRLPLQTLMAYFYFATLARNLSAVDNVESFYGGLRDECPRPCGRLPLTLQGRVVGARRGRNPE
jgi:hypothetical protein